MSYNPEYHKEYYRRNKEKYKYNPERREYNRLAAANWRKNNREKAMLSAAKARAKRLGYAFNIDLSDIVIPDRCPILDIKLEFRENEQHDGTPALDRIDNSLGYTKGNVSVISHKANRHKSDLTIDEITRLYNYVRERKKVA